MTERKFRDEEVIRAYDGLTAMQQLNLFRNLHYNDGNATENGIIANAINDVLPVVRKSIGKEVIRALECCANGECDECPYQESSPCKEYLNNAALDLINRQRAEIAALVSAVDNSTKEFLKLHDDYQDQKAEIVRLKAGKQSIKELADELCNRIGETGITDYNTYLCVVGLIQKVMGSPCTEDADCFTEEGEG